MHSLVAFIRQFPEYASPAIPAVVDELRSADAETAVVAAFTCLAEGLDTLIVADVEGDVDMDRKPAPADLVAVSP